MTEGMTTQFMPFPLFEPIHLVVEKTTLMKALGHCQGVVEKRNTVSILGHVLLEAQDSSLQITATDLEIALVESIPAHVHLHGSTTVSAHLLFDVVRKLPEGSEIELKTSEDGTSLLLRSGKSSYNFSCLPVTDFPIMTTENLPCTFMIHAGELSRLIDHTRCSMSIDETRYYLNGIYFHKTNDGFLRAVSTDGLRLSQAQIPLPPEASSMPGVIISRKTIYEIRKLIDGIAFDVTLSISNNQVQFTIGSCVLVSRLIEGNYPDYTHAIPLGNDQVLNVDAKAFSDAVDRISIMSMSDKLRPVKIRVEGKSMIMSAYGSETGSAVEELEINYDGEPLNFGFNARFILDVTQQLSSQKLQFLIGKDSEAIIAKDSIDDSALYVLMPMRV